MKAGLYFLLSKINVKCTSLISFSSFTLNSMSKFPCQKLQFFLKCIRPITKNIKILDSIPPQKFSSLAPEYKLQSTKFVQHLIVLSLYQVKKNINGWLYQRPTSSQMTTWYLNPFQPILILVHTTVTGTCRCAYKTCKNWPLCSYVG